MQYFFKYVKKGFEYFALHLKFKMNQDFVKLWVGEKKELFLLEA